MIEVTNIKKWYLLQKIHKILSTQKLLTFVDFTNLYPFILLTLILCSTYAYVCYNNRKNIKDDGIFYGIVKCFCYEIFNQDN